ncbi:hypothetical protein ACWD26_13300 [Streptomyces sp. NPDC002787]
MHSNEENDRKTGGLSTEDLAQPTTGTTEGTTEGTPGGAEETSSRAPLFPGEGSALTETESGGEAAETTTDEPGGGGVTDEAVTDEATPGAGEAVAEEPEGGIAAPGTPGASGTADEAPRLLTEDEEQGFRERWQEIQSQFVDEPREAVHAADTLVADVMQTLASTFAQHKKDLEGQWGQDEQVDTEELRGALRRYRSFFNRLLIT